jgi:hypothetical protein
MHVESPPDLSLRLRFKLQVSAPGLLNIRHWTFRLMDIITPGRRQCARARLHLVVQSRWQRRSGESLLLWLTRKCGKLNITQLSY